MKKLMLLLFLLLCVSVVAAAPECVDEAEVDMHKLLAQSKFFEYRAQSTSVMMQAVIDVLADAGADTAALTSAKDQFDALVEEVKAASREGDHEAYASAVDEGKALVASFKEDARALGTEFSVDRETVQAAIQEALQEASESLGRARNLAVRDSNRYRESHFSRALCGLERRAEERNISIDSFALGDYKDEVRKAYTAAVEACGDVPLQECDAEEVTAYKEMKAKLNAALRERLQAVQENRKAALEERKADLAETLEERKEELKEASAERKEALQKRLEAQRQRAQERRANNTEATT